jgi:F5/8 type C domain
MVDLEQTEIREREVEATGFAKSFAAARRSLGRGQDPTIRPDHADRSTMVRRGVVLCTVAGLAVAGTIGIGVLVSFERGHHSTSRSAASVSGLVTTKASSAAARPSPSPTHAASQSPAVAVTTVPVRVVTTVVVTAPGAAASTNAASAKTTSPKAAVDAPPAGYGTVNLALNKPVTVTSHTQNYVGSNITDGNVDSYWEGNANDFPQDVAVDLGSVQWVAKLVLSLPPVSDWNSRTQTITIGGAQSSTSPPQTIVPSAGYAFNANNGTGDAVTVAFAPVQTRYLILQFTANVGWHAAQLSELSAFS